eukprot:2683865-Pyramimonas_sp.AAC.1
MRRRGRDRRVLVPLAAVPPPHGGDCGGVCDYRVFTESVLVGPAQHHQLPRGAPHVRGPLDQRPTGGGGLRPLLVPPPA